MIMVITMDTIVIPIATITTMMDILLDITIMAGIGITDSDEIKRAGGKTHQSISLPLPTQAFNGLSSCIILIRIYS
jgi:hypothetical protein